MSGFFALGLGLTAWAHPGDDPHPEPISRPYPFVPPWATESGFCCMTFDVEASGNASNAQVAYCSDPAFVQVSKMAIATWIYEPSRNAEGEAVVFEGMQVYLSYIVRDDGKIVRNAEGFPQDNENPSGERPVTESDNKLFCKPYFV